MKVEAMKDKVCKIIDENSDKIIKIAKDIDKNPELGFKEEKTAAIVKDSLNKLNLKYGENIGITGLKSKLKDKSTGPNVAIFAELDAVICPESSKADSKTGAAHVCGHNLQIASMLGVAMGLKLSGIEDQLTGNVTFFAVAAEEFIEIAYREDLYSQGKINFFAGKQELIFRGELDDIDIAMMVHSEDSGPATRISIKETSNGFLAKNIQYLGKSAHAAEAPHEGINALNAAMIGLMGVNALRESFPDEDNIRVHPIITKGGDSVNSVPSDVRVETYVRANSIEALEKTNRKVDRALKAGAYALGAEVIIRTIPGQLPLDCSKKLNEVFLDNVREFMREDEISKSGHFFASTDMGDISQIMPAIHPFVGGVSGKLHSKDFELIDPYEGIILPAKILAMTVIDLLSNDGDLAKEVISSHKANLTKEEYIKNMKDKFS